MDFMAEKQAIINMEKALFEIPAYNINVDIDIDWSVEQRLPLFTLTTLTIFPGRTMLVELLHPHTKNLPYTAGCVQADPSCELDVGIVVWSGLLDNTPDRPLTTWISNFSSQQTELKQGSFVGWWLPISKEETKLADNLVTTAQNARSNHGPISSFRCLTLTTCDEQEPEWEWKDDHLSVDVSNVPSGELDPPIKR